MSDEALAREDEIEIPVQVNGKLRTVVRVPAESDEETVKAAALADEKVQARDRGQDGREGDRGAGQAGQPRGEVERCRTLAATAAGQRRVRGTQSFVHTLSRVLAAAFADWRWSSLWRWVFGIPALCADRIAGKRASWLRTRRRRFELPRLASISVAARSVPAR